MSLTWQDVPGWTDWFDLYDEVAMTTPTGTTVVEVGVAFGRSLLYLAQKIKETGKDIRIAAVDTWQPYEEASFIWQDRPDMPESERAAFEYQRRHGGVFPAFLYNIYQSGLSDMIDIVRADSAEASQLFHTPPRRPHFVFIDAAHDQESVRRDIDFWWDTHPEWMAGHDYNRGSEIHFPGVWKAVDEKFGRGDVERNVEWRGQTCWVVRQAHLHRPPAQVAIQGLTT